jgi:hypothetical protein
MFRLNFKRQKLMRLNGVLVSRRLRLGLLPAVVALLVAAGAVPAHADGIVDPAPIAPNNYFIGLVNDQSTSAVIKVGCFGPIVPNQTGHPLAGQTVKALPVVPPTSARTGYTGTAGTAILVTINGAVSTVTPIVLHDWAIEAPIPTSLLVPCGGTGVVTFTPNPTSPTARAATVTVAFVGQP